MKSDSQLHNQLYCTNENSGEVEQALPSSTALFAQHVVAGSTVSALHIDPATDEVRVATLLPNADLMVLLYIPHAGMPQILPFSRDVQ